VALGRLWNPCAVAGQPIAHLTSGVGHRFGPRKHTRIGHQPQEAKQARPGETDIGDSAELTVEPILGLAVWLKVPT
jgi:hypothetical protein